MADNYIISYTNTHTQKRAVIPLPLGSPLALADPSPCSPYTASLVRKGKSESCVAVEPSFLHWWSCHLPECPELGGPDKICIQHGCKNGITINITGQTFQDIYFKIHVIYANPPTALPLKNYERIAKGFCTQRDILVFLSWMGTMNFSGLFRKNKIKIKPYQLDVTTTSRMSYI